MDVPARLRRLAVRAGLFGLSMWIVLASVRALADGLTGLWGMLIS